MGLWEEAVWSNPVDTLRCQALSRCVEAVLFLDGLGRHAWRSDIAQNEGEGCLSPNDGLCEVLKPWRCG